MSPATSDRPPRLSVSPDITEQADPSVPCRRPESGSMLSEVPHAGSEAPRSSAHGDGVPAVRASVGAPCPRRQVCSACKLSSLGVSGGVWPGGSLLSLVFKQAGLAHAAGLWLTREEDCLASEEASHPHSAFSSGL